MSARRILRGAAVFLALFTAAHAPSVLAALPEACPEGQSPPLFGEAGTSEEDATAFLTSLQRAVAADDRKSVAAMIEFPIAAWTGKRDETFRTPASFLASYERVMTPRLRQTIAEAKAPCLFTNAQGVMIHDGEVWFRPGKGDALRIVKINGPIGPGR